MCHANEKNPAHAERNYGIDLLKIVSMIMVALLHVLGNGILSSSNIFSWHYELGYAIEILCFCAVNCYAIISGYLNYGAKFRYSRILQLYLQVLFYTCLITLGFYIAKPEVVTKTVVIRALFPFAFSDVYWYFTAYFCMFFFLPFLNRLIETLDRKSCDRLMITLAIIFSFVPLIPSIFDMDTTGAGRGYSFLWITVLYLVGAYIRKYHIEDTISKRTALLAYFACAALTWLGKFAIEKLTMRLYQVPSHGDAFVRYTAPGVLFCGVFLVLFFAKLRPGNCMQALIRFFAPVSFGVYLLHAEPLMWDHFLSDAFTWAVRYNAVVTCLIAIGAALAIWLAGSLVDHVRRLLFKLLHVDKLCRKVDKWGR